MKALTYHGKGDIRCESVPDPKIEDPRDAIIKVTACAICGSDLHIYDGVIPQMHSGDVLGHETMGEVVEVGSSIKKPKGRRPRRRALHHLLRRMLLLSARLLFRLRALQSGLSKSRKLWGHSPAGLFGYSHLLGGYRGGQAEYLRVPYADVGPIKVPDTLDDEQVLFLSDIFPTGYMAAEFCDIKPGDVVAIWGCGPVGQFAIRSAFLLGAERVIAIDTVPERLELAQKAGAETLDFHKVDVYEAIQEHDQGPRRRRLHRCGRHRARSDGELRLDVRPRQGRDLHGAPTGRMCCARRFTAAAISARSRSSASMAASSTRFRWARPINRGLTFRMAQTPVQHYLPKLLERIETGDIDPSFVITHRGTLDDGPELYKTFRDTRTAASR